MLITGILLYCPEYGLSKDADLSQPCSHAFTPFVTCNTQAFTVSVSCSTKFNQVFAMSIICSTKFTQAFAMSVDCSTKFTQAFAMSVDCSTNFTQAFAMSVDCSTKFTQAFVLQATDTTKAWERGYIPHPSHIIIHMQAFPVFHGSSSCSVHHCQFAKLETKRGLGMRLGGCGNLLCRSSQGLVIIVKDTVSWGLRGQPGGSRREQTGCWAGRGKSSPDETG